MREKGAARTHYPKTWLLWPKKQWKREQITKPKQAQSIGRHVQLLPCSTSSALMYIRTTFRQYQYPSSMWDWFSSLANRPRMDITSPTAYPSNCIGTTASTWKVEVVATRAASRSFYICDLASFEKKSVRLYLVLKAKILKSSDFTASACSDDHQPPGRWTLHWHVPAAEWITIVSGALFVGHELFRPSCCNPITKVIWSWAWTIGVLGTRRRWKMDPISFAF